MSGIIGASAPPKFRLREMAAAVSRKQKTIDGEVNVLGTQNSLEISENLHQRTHGPL